MKPMSDEYLLVEDNVELLNLLAGDIFSTLSGIQSNKWGRWLENYNKGTTGYCIKRCNDARYKWK